MNLLLAIAGFRMCHATFAAVVGDDAGQPVTYPVPGVTVVIQKHSCQLH